jgi:hypothetical protein
MLLPQLSTETLHIDSQELALHLAAPHGLPPDSPAPLAGHPTDLTVFHLSLSLSLLCTSTSRCVDL